jgi:UDP-glucose 4-epimerase
MNILIAGGFGFVGGRLGQHLQQTGHQVILGSRNARHAPHWLPSSGVVLMNWDDFSSLQEVCSGVDIVIHAAGMNALDCASNSLQALAVNGLATSRLINAASIAGVTRFIYLSTAHVYANPLTGTISEESCPRNLHPYATSHLAGENAVLSANENGLIEGVVLRLSNAFGAPVDEDVNCWTLFVNDLCRQAVENRKLVLRSHGLQQRDFITLQSTSRCIEHFLRLPATALHDGLFNVGGGQAVSIYEITLLIASRCKVVLGFMPTIERIEPQSQDVAALLEYSVAKLESTGCDIQQDFESEIDTTLSFCLKVFSDAR